jgi:hypothetical protein
VANSAAGDVTSAAPLESGNGPYTIEVRARRGDRETPRAQRRVLKIEDATDIPAPTILEPQSPVLRDLPMLRWTDVAVAEKFDVSWWPFADPAKKRTMSVVRDENPDDPANVQQMLISLNDGPGTYHAEVRALTSDYRAGPPGAIEFVYMTAPTPHVRIVQPTDGQLLEAGVFDLVWEIVEGAPVRYRVTRVPVEPAGDSLVEVVETTRLAVQLETPGRYRFDVQAIDGLGADEGDPASVTIVYDPEGGARAVLIRGGTVAPYNVAFVAEGYTLSEMPRFRADVAEAWDFLFDDLEPMKSKWSMLQTWRVDVVTPESGVGPIGVEYEGPQPGDPSGGKLSLPSKDALDRVLRRVRSSDGTLHSVRYAIVICNEERFTAGGWRFRDGRYEIYVTNTASLKRALAHLWGHAAGLGDEWVGSSSYEGGEPGEPNVATKWDPAQIKWRCLLEKEGIGIYTGGYGYRNKVYRPTRDACLMNRLGASRFCTVCRDHGLKPSLTGIYPNHNSCPRPPEWVIQIWSGGPR